MGRERERLSEIARFRFRWGCAGVREREREREREKRAGEREREREDASFQSFFQYLVLQPALPQQEQREDAQMLSSTTCVVEDNRGERRQLSSTTCLAICSFLSRSSDSWSQMQQLL